MQGVSENKLSKAKNKAFKLYKSIKTIDCPALNKKVKVGYEGWNHIEWKDAKHKRTKDQVYMRYLCFLSIKEILSKSYLFQEYKALSETVEVERNGKKFKENKLVQYYGFVGIVKVGNDRYRIRVVVKEVHGWDNADFLSVMPAWKIKGYMNFFGSEK